MDAPPFPTAPDQMSASWLESRTGFELERIEVLQIGEGSGFAGSVYRIRHRPPEPLIRPPRIGDLEEDLRPPSHSPPAPTARSVQSRGRFLLGDGWGSELGSRRHYFAGHDPTSGSICIIMEDLSGLRPGDQIAGCSEEESFAVVVELARLHSRFWNQPAESVGDWVPSFDAGGRFFQRLALAGLVETFKRGGDRSSEAPGCGDWNDGVRP